MPAMIKWTGMVAPRKSKELVTSLDIVPSIMTLVGGQISPDEDLHGLDLSKTIILDQKVMISNIKIDFFPMRLYVLSLPIPVYEV